MTELELQKTLFSGQKIEIRDLPSSKKKVTFKPYVQDQQFLLPKNLDEFVGPGHIARLVSTIVDRMNTSFVTATYRGGGASAYDPKMLLKAWILGFIYKVYSSRSLAKNLRESLPFIWASGNQAPDFRTLNNFRLRLKEDIKKIFKQIVVYALENGIIEAGDVFVDHTKKEANANKHKVVWKKQVETQLARIDQELEELFAYVDKVNEEEEETFGSKDLPEQERRDFDDEKVRDIVDRINGQVRSEKKTREAAREQKGKLRRLGELQERQKAYLEKKRILANRNSFSRTDLDAVAMMLKDGLTIRPAYNEGVAVENGLVLNYVVSQNCGDVVSFIPLMEGVVENLRKTPANANSDGAYGSEENMAFLERNGIGNYLKYGTFHKEKSRTWRERQKFRLEDFSYDPGTGEFTCRNGVLLKLEDVREETAATSGFLRSVSVYRAEAGKCPSCPFRACCTNAKEARTLSVSWNGERLRQQARQNLNSAKGIELRTRRGNAVESVFGDGKFNKGKRRYNLRGLAKVNLEAGIYYIAHNLRKIHAFFGQGGGFSPFSVADQGPSAWPGLIS